MRLIRYVLLAAAAAYAWRALRGRGHEALQRTLGLARPGSGRRPGAPSSRQGRGSHVSAASAANDRFRDDRDVVVGENLSAIGMRPGAI